MMTRARRRHEEEEEEEEEEKARQAHSREETAEGEREEGPPSMETWESREGHKEKGKRQNIAAYPFPPFAFRPPPSFYRRLPNNLELATMHPPFLDRFCFPYVSAQSPRSHKTYLS